MTTIDDNTKLKYVIKTLLCCFKEEKLSGVEISQFIVKNKLFRKTTIITPHKIYYIVMQEHRKNGTILNDVNMEKIDGKYHYWVCG